MKKLGIFPYQQDLWPLLRYQKMLQGYELTAVSAFKEDAYFLKRKIRGRTIAYEQVADMVDACDEILLGDNIWGKRMEKYKEVITLAQAQGKPVWASTRLCYQLPELTEENRLANTYIQRKNFQVETLFKIPVPIIAVCGLGENSSKWETQLRFYQAMRNWYKVIALSSNEMGALFGMQTYPSFLFDKSYTFQEKIIMLNHYIYDLCQIKKPDVVLLGIPGGIIPLSDIQYNDFSEKALIISSAISIDAAVLNLYFSQDLDWNGLEELKNICWYRYQMPIDAFVIARQKLDYNSETKEFDTFFLDDDLYQQLYADEVMENLPVVNLEDQEEVESFSRYLLGLLEENLDAV